MMDAFSRKQLFPKKKISRPSGIGALVPQDLYIDSGFFASNIRSYLIVTQPLIRPSKEIIPH
jgi:hypothetical protein